MIVIEFDNFRKKALEKNKRIYYFEVGNIIELYFLIEGTYVKSFIDLTKIDDKELFFGDKLFIGATKLLLNIKETSDDTVSVNEVLNPFISPIELNKTDEGENVDIQEEGVE